MNTPAVSSSETSVKAGSNAPTSRLMVLFFSDIVGSTELKNRLGTVEYAELLGQHDSIFREIIASANGGQILKDTGDGFFASFATASDAVRAALRFQWELKHHVQPLQARIGLHLGEVAELDLDSNGLAKVVGLAADFAARLMQLARGGQILLTRVTFNDARQFVRAHPHTDADSQTPALRWIAHGEYLFQGSDEPVEVFEVGAEGFAPFSPPPDTQKAARNVRPGDEETLGWRPAGGLEMQGRQHWVIKQKLGEGGFGEVWLAEHVKTGVRRVFKFCFEPARLRGLKREVVLFRLLKEALGDRRDIARIVDFQFDHSPYYIETEYFPAGTLHDWAASRGGLNDVPLEERIGLVANVAAALSAAHSVGVLHKDLKPSNILMRNDGSGFYPVITDFGIGILTDRSLLERHDITVVGFTQSAATENDCSRTGTRIYSPPESLLNKPFTVQGDVYALGVLLYQMVVGDLDKPVAEGWERDVADDLLREDIAECIEGNPERRLKSASELAMRLSHWTERRAARMREQETQLAARRRQRLFKVMAGLLIIALGLTAALSLALFERNRRVMIERSTMETEKRLRQEAENSRDQAQLEMTRAEREAARAAAVSDFLRDMLTSADPGRTNDPNLKVREVLDRAASNIDADKSLQPEIESAVRSAIGRSYITLGLNTAAQKHLQRAVELAKAAGRLNEQSSLKAYADLGVSYLYAAQYDKAEPIMLDVLKQRQQILGAEHPDTAESLYNLSLVYGEMRKYELADEYGRRALAMRERLFGPDSKEVASSLQYLAMYKHCAGDLKAAEPLYLRSLALRERTLGPDHFEVGNSHNNLGVYYIAAGQIDKAEPHCVKAFEILPRTLGEDHPNVAMAETNLGNIYVRRGEYQRALPLFEHALKTAEARKGSDHPDLVFSIYGIATIHYAMQQYDEAAAWYERAYKLASTKIGSDATITIGSQRSIGLVYKDAGKLDQAEPLLRASLQSLRRINNEFEALNTEVALVECMIMAGKHAEVEKMALELHERAVRLENAQWRETFTTQSLQLLVELYKEWEKPEHADRWRQKLMELTEPTTQPTPEPQAHPSTAPAEAS